MSDIVKKLHNPTIYSRRESIEVQVGDKPMGGKNPIRIQTMANVSTMDTNSAVEQAIRVKRTNADYLRFTAQGVKEATNLDIIKKTLLSQGIYIPLIADIHFNPKAASKALETVEKVRVNPGNFVDAKYCNSEWTEEMFSKVNTIVKEKFGEFVEKAKTLSRAIRIGVNHGSLSERMIMKYGDTPEGMVASALEFLKVCQEHNFSNVVISMKSSNVIVMTKAVRLMAKALDEAGMPAYPFHLGVTEAGEGEDGRIKSAIGIGSLLSDGIGDTIRVSLSEEPEKEIPVAKFLSEYISQRELTRSSDIKAEEYSWDIYDRVRIGDRKNILNIGNLFNKGFSVLIFAKETFPLDLETNRRPDYIISNNGKVYNHNKSAIISVETITIDCNNNENLLYNITSSDITNKIIILKSQGNNPIGDWRRAFIEIRKRGIKSPIILNRCYMNRSIEDLRIMASVDFGTILLDEWANGIMIECETVSKEELLNLHFCILQATRIRITKTEFISCPGCGRTLFDLQTTVGMIKKSVSHLKGLKIGVMGCIVNGPGEMADADYGYVGSTPGKIDMYKGQECVIKGIPQEKAVESLISLIKENGDWIDP